MVRGAVRKWNGDILQQRNALNSLQEQEEWVHVGRERYRQ